MNPDREAVLRLEGVAMTFAGGDGPDRTVLDGVDLTLAAGDSLALVGRSGSGKSTLLHLAAGISVPTRGRVLIQGRDVAGLDEGERSRLRRRSVGLVFQFFHLLPHLDVAENVALPGWIAGVPRRDLTPRVNELLEQVHLADRRHDPVGLLSGGEQQRVAICRALVNRPALLLADEPTGSLDDRTGRGILDMLLAMTTEAGCALLLVTHSREVAAAAGRRLGLHDGHLVPVPGAVP